MINLLEINNYASLNEINHQINESGKMWGIDQRLLTPNLSKLINK